MPTKFEDPLSMVSILWPKTTTITNTMDEAMTTMMNSMDEATATAEAGATRTIRCKD